MITTCFPSPRELGITGNQERLVYQAIALGRMMTFDDIKRFMDIAGVKARETAISARIRDINRRLKINNIPLCIKHKPKKQGSHDNAYWLAEI